MKYEKALKTDDKLATITLILSIIMSHVGKNIQEHLLREAFKRSNYNLFVMPLHAEELHYLA